MTPNCPHCTTPSGASKKRPEVIRIGRFHRRSDSRDVQRFSCKGCGRGFSHATAHPCYRQNKRQKNHQLLKLLCSGVSQRRAAILLNLNRTTVVRKFLFLAREADKIFAQFQTERRKVSVVEFDDIETFEHTKCKPLSIGLAVEFKTRRALGFAVSRMPAKGKLAKISRAKYGPRTDERKSGREKVFAMIQPYLSDNLTIKTDQNPHYTKSVQKLFPHAQHVTFKGRKGCVVGQGELKKIGFDPIFSFNHTAAKLRADINRLFRRTWCTTKRPERLAAHLAIYLNFHNQRLNLPV